MLRLYILHATYRPPPIGSLHCTDATPWSSPRTYTGPIPHQPRSPDMADSFATRARLDVNGMSYTYASLAKLGQRFDLAKLPYAMKILLENLLRHEDGVTVLPAHIEAVAQWDPKDEPE